MDAEEILDRPCGFDKAPGGFAHRAASEFSRISGPFRLDADLVQVSVRGGSGQPADRLAQVLELSLGELGYGQGRIHDWGTLRRLLKPPDEFKVSRARQFAEHHLLNGLSLHTQMGDELCQQPAISRIPCYRFLREIGNLDVEIAGWSKPIAQPIKLLLQ